MAILKVKSGGEWVGIPSVVGPQGESGGPGPSGSPGVSPTIAINDISGGHRIAITDANGTHTVDVLDGENGDAGRGIVSVQKTGTVGLVDTYTITYTDNTTSTFTVTNGQNGTPGADGTTFTPSVSDEGVISWTNDGGKTNPQPMNIKGPQGDKGDKGDTGSQGPKGDTGATGATGPAGPKGDPGDDYVLTAADKAEIAQQAAEEVDVPVQDVQVNGTSVLDTQGVANVLITQYVNLGTENDYPLSAAHTAYPIGVTLIYTASNTSYPYGTGTVVTIRSANARGVQLSFGNSSNSYKLRTADINGWSDWHTMGDFVVTVSGTTPAINAQAGICYVCGEVATISITPPASGCIDVVFKSGSTPTVLTITPPTGVTIKWANGFDPTSLEANATYEINIMNGLGVAASWT